MRKVSICCEISPYSCLVPHQQGDLLFNVSHTKLRKKKSVLLAWHGLCCSICDHGVGFDPIVLQNTLLKFLAKPQIVNVNVPKFACCLRPLSCQQPQSLLVITPHNVIV
ncbi:hypothetical protein LY76DRAFT_359370, partial [Colletotrichum caudatum]